MHPRGLISLELVHELSPGHLRNRWDTYTTKGEMLMLRLNGLRFIEGSRMFKQALASISGFRCDSLAHQAHGFGGNNVGDQGGNGNHINTRDGNH